MLKPEARPAASAPGRLPKPQPNPVRPLKKARGVRGGTNTHMVKILPVITRVPKELAPRVKPHTPMGKTPETITRSHRERKWERQADGLQQARRQALQTMTTITIECGEFTLSKLPS